MRYAFVDESGTETPFSGSRFLNIALVSAAHEQDLSTLVRRTYKKFGRGTLAGELKAATSSPTSRRYLLAAIADTPLWVVTVALDKRAIQRPPSDSAEIYRWSVARTVRLAAQIWPEIEICLDRRYSVARLRDQLDQAIYAAVADLSGVRVSVRQEDSTAHKGLQVADFVAWALHRKYEHEDMAYYQIVAAKILVEDLIARQLW